MSDRPTAVALIPARAGSQRVPLKNVKTLAGHPLLGYAIGGAQASGRFDRIVVSTDSADVAEIAERYGADVPGLRPPELATATSPDIEWLTHLLGQLDATYETFAILRPTSPFRSPEMIQRGIDRFLELSASHGIDSLRAVERVKQHPGKMWVIDGDLMTPLLDQSHLPVAWHAGQYQALPVVHVQNSSLEVAWTRVVREHGTREGEVVAPFLTDEVEGFSIDYPDDWERAELLVATGRATLPPVRPREATA